MKKTVKQCIAILSIFLLLAQSVVTPFLVSPVYAVSAWSQTDWSSGVGASTTNQYASGSSIDATTTSGQVVLSRSEKLTNTGFGSDNSSWSVAAVPPSGWVEVPGDATYSTTNFLAMQYEAKYDCTGDNDGDTAVTCSAPADSGAGLDYRDIGSFDTAKVVSTANGAPIVHITQTQAISACPTGHLITNNEWMTVARNAEAQTGNWANGTIGSTVASGGGLKRGNVGITDSASYNGADPEQGTGRDTKAKLTLSNSSELWDLSGNVWEWNSNTITEANQPDVSGQSGFAWRELTALTSYGTLSYDLVRPLGSTYDANYGVGRIYHNSGSVASTVYAFQRGGPWSDGAYAGVFALSLYLTPGSQYYGLGFRCASDPVAIFQSFSSSSGRSAAGGNSVEVGAVSDAKLYQSVNVGDTATYNISAYVYNNTAGSVGGTVDATVATLYYGGYAISSAVYTPVSGETGWYKLTGTVTGVASAVHTGVLVKTGKTVIVDDVSLLGAYASSGTLTSNIFDTSQLSEWGTLSFSATTPTNTTATVKARTSNSSDMTGATAFASCTAISSGADISANSCVTDGHRYIQYEVALATTDTTVTSTFSDITINYTAFDTTAPAISLTALTPDPHSDATPTVSGTATDATSTVSAVQFQMDSTAGSWTACTATDGAFDEASEAFTCAVTTALSDGSHTIYVRATDSLSNTTTGGSETTDVFTIDTVSSSLSLTAITPDPGTDTTPTLTGTATDATSTISAVQFQMDSTSGSWSSCTADDGSFNEASEAFTCTVTTALSDGSHTIYVRSTDAASNTSTNASDTFTVDTTGPISKDLDYPADGSYINSQRPTFKWKAFSDATSGLSNYKLEVTRADSDSNTENTGFTIDGIEVSRTTTYFTSRYNIEYENFSDTDSENNYLKVTTKSSSDWGSGANDGKLKEGKYHWKITATDAAGNTVTSSKAFYVDLTNPVLTATVDSLGEVDDYQVVTNLKPKISGKLTDNYAVDKIEFAFYKQNFFLGIETNRTLYTLETLNHPSSATTSWSYSFSPSQHLDYGKYILEVKGYDKAGNGSTMLTTNLQVLSDTAARFLLLSNAAEDKEEIVDKIRDKAKVSLPALEKQAKIRRIEEAANLTKLAQENTRLLSRIISGIGGALLDIGNAGAKVMARLGFQTTLANNFFGRVYQDINRLMTDFETSSQEAIARSWSDRGTRIKKVAGALNLAYLSFKEPAAKGVNFFYRVKVAIDTTDAILFDPDPTRITNVTIEEMGTEYAIVSWDTNHFTKNNKLNYGRDLSYGQEAWGEDYAKHHTIKLTGLKPETEYFFEVMSQNKNYAYDAYYRFETK